VCPEWLPNLGGKGRMNAGLSQGKFSSS